ncbi:ATP-binding protein [Algoriphagus sp. D3-2-R+10]|uniref:ATP-binding protein n=1 Tax=Algoriphagus aurantiacus TaxID=3103948 RepID=UPI002B3ED733|nr:ATP-binding protein [Algoriphagus sp. D3-2-R+10]MEB2773851.1 ATP-binding protein [Algoriphagus sp. D3-2-R+10]
MIITEAIKAELAKWLDTYWTTYMKGDFDIWSTFIAEDYYNIGGTKEEIWHTKQEILDYSHAIHDQMVGQAEFRNRQIEALPYGDYVMVNEFTDLYVKIEGEWTYYGPFRMSSLLEKTDTGWIALHQHGSYPDMKAMEGEAFASDALKAENKRLQEAVDQRTSELLVKNRELEIETSLEKVRAVAMGMKKPEDMLDVCRIISDQLQQFGVDKIRNVQLAIIDENIGQYLCYQYFTPYDKIAVEITEYLKSPVEHGMVKQMLASRDGYFIGNLSGQELEEFRSHRIEANHFSDPFLDKAIQLDYCFLSIGEGGLGLTVYQPMADDVLTLFKRFHQVFSLAYQRFRDIQKAEEQVREAQIEASLERVRAQTMAMHSSEDVGKCVVKMFSELTALGVDEGTRFGIGILNHNNENNQLWTARKDGDEVNMHIGNINMASHPLLKSARKAWLAQVPFHRYVLEGEDLMNYYQMLNNAPGYKIQIPLEKLPKREIQHCFIFEYGFFYAFSPREFQPELIHITKRFSSLFEQTYRRYLDLVRAEAQAREAEIELALERVRARTMAMQHSDELTEASEVLYQQVFALGIEIWGCAFHIYADDPEGDYEWFSSSEGSLPFYKTPRENFFLKFYEKGKAGETFHVEEFLGEDCKVHYDYLMTIPVMGDALREIVASGASLPESQYDHIAFFKHGFLLFITYKQVPESHAIFQRFSKVFEQTYTRFLDLQKAEAQAKKAKIEAALERVRSRTMAMHHTEELKEVIQVVFEQLVGLKIHVEHAGFILDYKEREDMHIWLADHQQGVPTEITIPYFDSPHWNSYLEAKAKGESFFANLLPFEVKNKFYSDLFELIPELTEEAQQVIFSKPALAISTVLLDNVGLYIEHYSETPFTAEENAVLMRFGKVFQQTYTRFLDLQKAEALAREARIEAALERVRSRSMAMHKTDELQEVVRVVAEELKHTGVILDTWGAVICTYFQDSKDVLHWTASEDPANPSIAFLLPYFKDELFDEAWESKERGDSYFAKVFSFEVKNAFFNHAFEHSDYRQLPDDYKKQILESETHGIAWAWAKNSAIMIPSIQGDLPSEDEKEILIRFARVFEQSFIRFLDLQKAEAQAREAQIEAALERVRSRSMAMHKSEDLLKVITVVSEQLQHLNFKFNTVSFAINSQKHDYTFWFAILGDPTPIYIQVPYIESPMFDRMKDVLASGLEFYADTLTPEENRRWHEHVFQHAVLPSLTEDTKAYILRSGYARSIAIKPSIMLIVSNYAGTPYSDIENEILKRFGTVFEQSYTRFLDLKKAEAQAREAQIEAALEKVRGRSMAMQKSEELPDAANLLFRQIQTLGMPAWSAGYCLWDKDKQGITAWMSSEGVMQPPFHAPLNEDPTFIHMRESYEHGESLHVEAVGGEELVTHYEYMRTLPVVGDILDSIISAGHPLPTLQVNHAAYFSHGYLLFITYQPVPEAHDIFKRFAKVFEQTYTRFLDLKKAEAQAREATKQASLDRVRGIIASMRSANDLELITPLIFRELTILGVPFIRCGIFIIQEKQEIVEAYLSSPDGNSLGLLRLPYQASELTNQTVEAWRKGVVYRQHWNKEDFVHWIKLMMDQDQIQDSSTYQGAAAPPESLDLHFIPFTQGMLYVGAENPLDVKELELVQALAKAFSIAYARYEDFVKLEQAKAEVESAMSELKATQFQLIQQEKLASLGQLTAGIAHEIKNPLNFVNNFSEVSIEMIEEAKEERSKSQESRDETLVDEILEDIKSNLEKIHQHGSRANGIVTSMLQHSRGGSGKMEPTDLNALVKEYVNLSFHGMRAGKNPIDVDIQLDLDTDLGMVSLIKEDFTRVVINLCNNAFDALRQKTFQGLEVYHPKLTVRTKSENGTILIEIEDNGPGIPDEIKDKILQPFFTTKKGTEGTGLGLSITHDIIKAHGGELEIETSINKGTTFIIKLNK